MAAVAIEGVLAVLAPVLKEIEPLVEGVVGDVIKKAMTDFQTAHPGQTVWQVFGEAIKNLLSNKTIQENVFNKLHLAGFVAKISNMSAQLVKFVNADPNVTDTNTLAIHWDTAKIASALEDGLKHTASAIRNKIFDHDPTGVIKGQVDVGKTLLVVKSQVVKDGVSTVLSRMDSKDMADKSPIALIATKPELTEGIPPEHVAVVTREVTRLARIQSLAPSADAMKALATKDISSSQDVLNTSPSSFIAATKDSITEKDATQVIANAISIKIRNENLLVDLLQLVKGSGLAALDGEEMPSTRKFLVQSFLDNSGTNLSLENLFGSMDQLISNPSSTVYSPASYFVELLMYLRNNNLDEKTLNSHTSVKGEPDSIKNTPLEFLFRRRPDLGDLELTPENTDTVLPYIDLANEVMESFIVNLPKFRGDANVPKQVTLDAFNVGSEDTQELLSQPQNVKENAYRELASAVYPTTLPYHQPLDTQRVFLDFLKVKRKDLVDAFRPHPPSPAANVLDAAKAQATRIDSNTPLLEQISKYQRKALDNQVNCEVIGLVQEEFLILTKEVFWPLEFFEVTEGIQLSSEEYQRRVGLRSPWECWGYQDQKSLYATDRSGLQFVEAQLLKRAGIAYTDLIDIVQTNFVNPNLPTGKSKTIFDQLRFSYRFLQTLVDPGSTVPSKRYGRLADFLVSSQHLLRLGAGVQNLSATNENGSASKTNTHSNRRIKDQDIKNWVINNFESMGQITVLESGEGPTLEVSGLVTVVNTSPSASNLPPMVGPIFGILDPKNGGRILDSAGVEYQSAVVAILSPQGDMKDASGNIIGRVVISGKALYGNPVGETTLNAKFPGLNFTLTPSMPPPTSRPVTWMIADGFLKQRSQPPAIVQWVISERRGGSGSIENVTLSHLDGSPLSIVEWDRLHRFTRIWRKLGWSVTETDRALTGLSVKKYQAPQKTSQPVANGDLDIESFSDLITFDDFVDSAGSGGGNGGDGDDGSLNPDPNFTKADITLAVIEQIAAVIQILPMTSVTVDLTVEQLLTFWTPMSSRGTSSLYYRLFFTRNLRNTDAAFGPDQNGDYFTGKVQTIFDHRVMIMAAFSLTMDDLQFLLQSTGKISTVANGVGNVASHLGKFATTVDNVLSMENLSAIYRCSLMASVLGVKISDLTQIIDGMGNPFASPVDCLRVLQTWEKMKSIPFPWEELRYILDSVPSPTDPLAPTKLDSLRVSKELHDGIIDIQKAHPFIDKEAEATDDLIANTVGLVFSSQIVAGVLALIHGTTVYTTSTAPAISDESFSEMVSKSVPGKKIAYTLPAASDSENKALKNPPKLQVTGILTDDEIESLKAVVAQTKDIALEKTKPRSTKAANGMSADSQSIITAAWSKAVDSVCAQSKNFFCDNLTGIFPDESDIFTRNLLASDIAPPPEVKKASNDTPASINGAPVPEIPQPEPTAGKKALYFLKYFIPFLQETLAHSFIITTVASEAGFQDHALAKTMLDNIVVLDNSGQSAIQFLLKTVGSSADIWQGYMSPNTLAETVDEYVFYLPDGQKPPPLTIDGATKPFVSKPVGRVKMWQTEPITLDSAAVYTIGVARAFKENLQWSGSDSVITTVPMEVFYAWKGSMSLTSGDAFTFSVVTQTNPGRRSFMLDNEYVSFGSRPQQVDPEPIWSTSPISLDSTKLHSVQLKGMLHGDLWWKAGNSPRSSIPDSNFLPDFATGQMFSLFEKLKKLALLLNHFKMSSDEIRYISGHKEQFNGLTFNNLADITQWERIYSFTTLRNSLPANQPKTLLDLFAWSTTNVDVDGEDRTDLAQQISDVTSWPVSLLLPMLTRINFSTGKADSFRDERILCRLQKLVELANQLKVDVPRLFAWASPLGTATRDYFKYSDVARDIQHVARSRFSLSSWADAVRPMNDKLRENQKTGLISYLLVQQDLVEEANITDADSLFEYFLIDVNMTPLVQTSRIKQAISTVQLYIQRCMLGLEEDKGVKVSALDRTRWEWMQKYRVWEANRKIYLYPENWIEPTLRDDKSEFFKQLESALLQKDLNNDVVYEAIRSFLYQVDTVSNLEAIGLYVDYQDGNRVHVFARTRTSPLSYYYNSFLPADGGYWKGWETMAIDIPHYTISETGTIGNYVSPIVYNGRVMLFVAQILNHVIPGDTSNTSDNPKQTLDGVRNAKIGDVTPKNAWEIQMSWTEYRNGKWTARQTCPSSYIDYPITQTDVAKYSDLSNKAAADATARVTDLTNAQRAAHGADSASLDAFQKNVNNAQDALTAANMKAQQASLKVARVKTELDLGPASIDSYRFVPSLVQVAGSESTSPASAVRVYMSKFRNNGTLFIDAGWTFNGTQLSFMSSDNLSLNYSASSLGGFPTTPSRFGTMVSIPASRQPTTLRSFQAIEHSAVNGNVSVNLPAISNPPYIEDADSHEADLTLAVVDHVGPSITLQTDQIVSQPFYHKYIHQLVVSSAGSGDVANVFNALGGLANSKTDFQDGFGGSNGTFNELGSIYSLYNWELGLHAPMTLIDRLHKAQQYEQALNVCHYVFNPLNANDLNLKDPSGSKDIGRFWAFPPFKSIQRATVESIFAKLKPGTPDAAITAWRKSPFNPHVVARNRPQAYMKWIVMTYIKILIDYGDSLFRQNTLETIPLAIQLYVLASHIYGPRGQIVPRCDENIKPATYNQLATQFDAFGNAMVQLEEAFPFSNQTPLPVNRIQATEKDVQLANIFGGAGALYFAIPDNPDLRALADTIDDRLFKIRHSQDINGVFRSLPLFEPPIDPALLVQATAQGLSISSVLSSLNGPMPTCRFSYLLNKALELANETKSLGQALLSASEKKDSETYSALLASHELLSQTATMDLKKLAVDDAKHSLVQLQYQRRAPVSRLTYFINLIGGNLSGIPDIDREFLELDAKIETPVANGGFALSPFESQEMTLAGQIADVNLLVGSLETAAGLLYAIPTMEANGSPIGIGTTLVINGANFGALVSAYAKGISIGVENMQYQTNTLTKKGQYQRALQDRIMQANNAGYEISQIDKQITAAQIHIDMANKEIELQQSTIDQAQERLDFVRTKYSNAELYTWMEGQSKTLFYNAYTQAFALAQKAEKAFKFERPQKQSTSYIQRGYWDASRNGLLSGEGLYLALKNLESAYQDERGYDYEVSKAVSLRRLDPLALISLREGGSAKFSIPEILLDMDFPGHYLRRLKGVSITIPCIVGPYTSLNATLTLTNSKYRTSPSITPQYAETIDSSSATDPRFATVSVPIQSIAVSSGQNDNGVLELDFRDECSRYLPFEGAGAISDWTLELPTFRQFDYASISDVIVQLKYTSLEGGVQLKSKATDEVSTFLKKTAYSGASGGLIAVFDVKNEFALAWSRLVTLSKPPPPDSTDPQVDPAKMVIDMPDLDQRLPIFTRAWQTDKIAAATVWLLVETENPLPGTVTLVSSPGSKGKDLTPGGVIGGLQSYQLGTASPVTLPFKSWQLHFGAGEIKSKKCWMLVRYVNV